MEQPRIRAYVVTSRGRMPGIVAGLLIVGIGALLVALGLTVLAGLTVVGTVGAVGAVAYRSLRGGFHRATGRAEPRLPSSELDPANEVFPPPQPPKSLDAH